MYTANTALNATMALSSSFVVPLAGPLLSIIYVPTIGVPSPAPITISDDHWLSNGFSWPVTSFSADEPLSGPVIIPPSTPFSRGPISLPEGFLLVANSDEQDDSKSEYSEYSELIFCMRSWE